MDLEILRKIGLSPGEIKVYSALLDTGLCTMNILHEKVGIERRNIYDILNKLIERGLVSYVEENNKRRFQITHPNKIIGFIEEKKKEWDDSKNNVEKQLPDMIKIFNEKKSTVRTEIYRGIEGVKAFFEDLLSYPETYWIGGGRYLPKRYPGFFVPWNKRREKLKIQWHYLMRHELRKEYTPFKYEKVKFLPEEFSGAPTVIGVFGNKVGQLLLGEEMFVFVIESKELADNYKKYHQYLWKNVAKD